MTRIRITGAGIHGLAATEENPAGEYPIGHEFDIEGELPAGWAGRAEVVGKAHKDAKPVTNDGDDDAPKPRGRPRNEG